MNLTEEEKKAMQLADSKYFAIAKNKCVKWSDIYIECLEEVKKEKQCLEAGYKHTIKEVTYISNLKRSILLQYEKLTNKLEKGKGFKKINVTIDNVNYKSIKISKNKHGELRIVVEYNDTGE